MRSSLLLAAVAGMMASTSATAFAKPHSTPATTFCWATELAMVREPVTLTVKEAREVSDQMQRLHAASFKTELRNLTSIDLDGGQAVRLAFMSCRAASAFKRAVEAAQQASAQADSVQEDAARLEGAVIHMEVK